MGEPLENDPHNGCVGCGPANERGLRLSFERTPEGARSTMTTQAWQEGWPGSTHTAFLYMALLETMNWTVYARRGRVGLPTRTGALDTRRRVQTGETLTLVGNAREDAPEHLLAEARALDATGALVARLERAYDFPDREGFARRMGYDELPGVLRDLLP